MYLAPLYLNTSHLMIVKIFRPSATFRGVRYNTKKIDKDKGELMKVANFGPLQGLSELRPEDYINYLEMVSTQNKRIRYPQFHAAISAKGKTHDKQELTRIAELWLKEMGYKDQPYMIIFHKDTRNNHVHVVTTRIDKAGKKINSAFEKNRAIQSLNKIIGLSESEQAAKDLKKALGYSFSTKAQFLMILESMGYIIKEEGEQIQLIKYGARQLAIRLSDIKQKITQRHDNSGRAAQLTAIFEKYRKQYATELVPKTIPLPGGLIKNSKELRSEFSDLMNDKFGLQLVFHSKDGKPVYGYTVIDHAQKNVFKGNQILSKDILLATGEQPNRQPERIQGPQLIERPETLADPAAFADDATSNMQENSFEKPVEAVNISISDDIDDEAILGRNRRRKRKARTNTR